MNEEIVVRNQLVKYFSHYIPRIQSYGADHIGYRYFLPDGSSFGFSTNDQWYTNKDQKFYDEQKIFLIAEIEDLIANNSKHTIRSLEVNDNYYLNELKSRSMSNSLGIYNFAPNKIEHFFFHIFIQKPFSFSEYG